MPNNYLVSRRHFLGYSAAAALAATLPGRVFAKGITSNVLV